MSGFGTQVIKSAIESGLAKFWPFFSKSHFKPVTHVIFDVDGLILDTETIYLKIYKDIAAKYGKNEYPWEVREKVMGRREEDSAAIFIREMGLPVTIEEFRRIQRRLEKERLLNCKIMSGAEKLILHLKKHKIPTAAASSSSIESIKIKFKYYQELYKCFNHTVSGTSDPEVKNGKPEPDIFLICASRFPDKPKPQNCLVFEDAPSGVVAAKKANMQVVMVPDKKISPKLTKEATIVLKSLDEFKPELFSLPPFSK